MIGNRSMEIKLFSLLVMNLKFVSCPCVCVAVCFKRICGFVSIEKW
jgi:hypothetical protein